MTVYKVFCHLIAIFKIAIYKIAYGKRILIGRQTSFRKYFSLLIGDKGKVIIGERCFFNNGCSINALNEIVIGNGTIVGENVKIYDHNHRFNKTGIPIKKQGYSIGKVSIGNDCWIGSNVVILKDTEIGNNCVIGAGCIVSGKVKSKTVLKVKQQFVVEELRMESE